MKKLLSIMLVLVLAFSMIPLSASAVTYDAADFTKINVGTVYNMYLPENGEDIYRAVNLTAGKTYFISAELSSVDGANNTLSVGLFPAEFSDNYYEDLICSDYNSSFDAAEIKMAFTPEKSGIYGLDIYGECYYNGTYYSGGYTNLTLTVYEAETVVYEIYTAEDFINITERAYLADFENKRVTLNFKNDIDLQHEILPYPEYDVLVVNGNGCTVSGIGGPLFGDVRYECVVNDLDAGFYIESGEDAFYNSSDLAAYVAYTYAARFTDCDASGSFYLCYEFSEDIGAFAGDVGMVSFENCTLEVDLLADYDANYIGGYVGYCYDKFFMNNCTAVTSIDVRNEEEAYCVGGIVGYIEDYGRIENSSAVVDIYTSNLVSVGGIAGAIDEANLFKNVSVEGSVTGTENVGGFLGASDCCGYNDIINCYAAVDVYAVSCFGGFAGYTYEGDSFRNCYAAGTVNYIGEEVAYHNDGGTFLGYASYSEITLDNCYGSMTDGYDIYGYSPEAFQCRAFNMNFENETAVANLEKSLNDYVDGSDVDGLLYWGDRNDMNGPRLITVVYAEGDVNGDGSVDVFDYMMVKSHYFKNYTLTDEEFKRADLSPDGNIDVFDYMAVKQLVMNNN